MTLGMTSYKKPAFYFENVTIILNSPHGSTEADKKCLKMSQHNTK